MSPMIAMADKVNKMHNPKGRAAAVNQTPRPFQCNWPEGCSKSFNRKSDLQRHYRIHTNERPYACDYKPCEKTFIQRSALTVHRRTHTGDKPHKCPYSDCGKCFSDSSSLARHRRIHTNDKPYICKNPHCRKAFCRKTTMTKHFRKEHPSESLNEDGDAEYSDIAESEEDPRDSTKLSRESSRSTFHPNEAFRETPPAPRRASTYSANLWSLPGQSNPTSRPQSLHGALKSRRESAVELIKIERASRTPQRTFTDPFPDGQDAEFMHATASSLPESIPMTCSVSHPSHGEGISQPYMAHHGGATVWPSHTSMTDSPTSLDSASSSLEQQSHAFAGQLYNEHALAYGGAQSIGHYNAAAQAPDLQPVQDIILDEPPQTHYDQIAQSQPSQRTQYASAPSQPVNSNDSVDERGNKQHPEPFTNELPPTPIPSQALPYTSMADLPFQDPQILPATPFETYPTPLHYPPRGNISLFNGWGKELKDDVFETTPGQLLGRGSWGNE